MLKQKTLLKKILFSAVLLSGYAQSAPLPDGKQITFDRSKGNCLACHKIADGEMAGNIGPELINMKQRFSDRKTLRKQIWDATIRNPETSMPPFGRNKILSTEELERVVEYIWSL